MKHINKQLWQNVEILACRWQLWVPLDLKWLMEVPKWSVSVNIGIFYVVVIHDYFKVFLFYFCSFVGKVSQKSVYYIITSMTYKTHSIRKLQSSMHKPIPVVPFYGLSIKPLCIGIPNTDFFFGKLTLGP
jgi:hypothetical protein